MNWVELYQYLQKKPRINYWISHLTKLRYWLCYVFLLLCAGSGFFHLDLTNLVKPDWPESKTKECANFKFEVKSSLDRDCLGLVEVWLLLAWFNLTWPNFSTGPRWTRVNLNSNWTDPLWRPQWRAGNTGSTLTNAGWVSTLMARPDFLQFPAYRRPIWPTPLA